MLDKVTIRKFSDLSGYSEDAIRSKIKDGIWRENQVYFRAPDKRILISLGGFEQWVKQQFTKTSVPHLKIQSNYDLPIQTRKQNNAKGLKCSPPPLI